MCVCLCVCVHVCVRAQVSSARDERIRYLALSVDRFNLLRRAYFLLCVCAHVHVCAFAHVRAVVHACMSCRACVHACMQNSTRARLHCVHTYVSDV